MKRFSLFGFLFLLFWAIPFPMLMYYGGKDIYTQSSPQWALTWLGISLVLWLVLLYRLFNGLVLRRILVANSLNKLMQTGELKTARIVEVIQQPQEIAQYNKYKVVLEFENFVGTTIHDSIFINDENPALNRYVAGKSIKIRLDRSLTNGQYIQVDGAHYQPVKMQRIVLGVIFWLMILAAAAWYYVYSYRTENNGAGWRFMVWHHPLILCPLLLMAVARLSRFGKLTKNQLLHKYFGYETTAQVINAQQTGVYINEQPQVRFDLIYSDNSGVQHSVSVKKIINLLNMDFARQKTLSIFYLKDNPEDICLAADL